MRDKDWTYSWLNSDNTKNGGDVGTADGGDNCFTNTRCDTEKYVADVNAATLCGVSDWRLPAKRELLSIVAKDRVNPAIDATFIPNTQANSYWSASPYANLSNYAWFVDFDNGHEDAHGKSYNDYVRLVRGGQ